MRGSVASPGLSESGLVIGIARGSHQALAGAYSRHGATVHGVARRVCGPIWAADVTQDVFLGLWRDPERFDPGRGPRRSFLVVQARGRSIDVLPAPPPAEPGRRTSAQHRPGPTGR